MSADVKRMRYGGDRLHRSVRFFRHNTRLHKEIAVAEGDILRLFIGLHANYEHVVFGS
jgi:hypothetical protein